MEQQCSLFFPDCFPFHMLDVTETEWLDKWVCFPCGAFNGVLGVSNAFSNCGRSAAGWWANWLRLTHLLSYVVSPNRLIMGRPNNRCTSLLERDSESPCLSSIVKCFYTLQNDVHIHQHWKFHKIKHKTPPSKALFCDATPERKFFTFGPISVVS